MLPFKEKNNQIVFLNPNELNPAAGMLPGTAQQFSNAAGGVNRADIHFKNFGPRIGFAYAFNEKTVVQAGYNIAYLNGGSYEYGTSKVATTYGNLLLGSFQVSSNGTAAPAYGSWDTRPLPAPPATSVGPQLGIGTRIEAFDPKTSGIAPYLQQWNINLQRQIPWNTFLQVAYIGNTHFAFRGSLILPARAMLPSCFRTEPCSGRASLAPPPSPPGSRTRIPTFLTTLARTPPSHVRSHPFRSTTRSSTTSI